MCKELDGITNMDDNRRRYMNVIRKLDLNDENIIGEALMKKGFFSDSSTFPLSSLHFELTSKCNAFCRHCYNNSGNQSVCDAMTPEKWIDFSRYLVSKGGVFECLLSGGEPFLLGDSLFEIMDILHDDGTIFLLMTNGYLLTGDIVDKLKKYKYHWFQISIDGIDPQYHDWFRGCSGSWEKAVNAARMIGYSGIPLKIACCITPYNLKDTEKMISLADSLGASSIIVGEVSLSGRVNENNDLLLSSNQRKELWNIIRNANEKHGGRIKIKTTNKVKSGLEHHAKKPRSCAVIRPNGDIRIDGMAPFVIGNIIKDDFETIWESKIDSCWNDERVQHFISNFDINDRNQYYINYIDDDIYL